METGVCAPAAGRPWPYFPKKTRVSTTNQLSSNMRCCSDKARRCQVWYATMGCSFLIVLIPPYTNRGICEVYIPSRPGTGAQCVLHDRFPVEMKSVGPPATPHLPAHGYADWHPRFHWEAAHGFEGGRMRRESWVELRRGAASSRPSSYGKYMLLMDGFTDKSGNTLPPCQPWTVKGMFPASTGRPPYLISSLTE